jgi:HEAT repeat protein
MMRYALILILSLFHIPSVGGYSSIDPKGKTNQYIALNENSSAPESNVYLTASKDNFPVQLGAFRIKSNAEALYNKIISEIGNDARIIFEDSLYKVRVTAHDSRRSERASAAVPVLKVVNESSDSVMISDTTQAMFSAASDTLNETGFLSDTMENTEVAKAAVRKIFFLNGDSPWLLKINYFGKSLAFVNALIATIIFSIASMIILLIIILLNKRRLEREEILHQYLLEKYQGLIIDYLFGNASPEEFSVIASNTYRRQVLIDQMIDVSVNLKGDEGKKLLSLYKYLKLDKDSIARAYDFRWHKKIKGFRELAFMNIKDANDEIYKALNSKNDILRMEAQIAMVRLSEREPFEFLSHLRSPFSLWEQITLHELILQHNIPVPSFQKWLTSPNPTVVMFCLRMIREFKQKEAEDSIRETLSHPDIQVKQLVIQVAGDLEMRSTAETMKHMYKNEEYNVCLEIVRSLGKMPDLSMLGFLKMVLDKEDDVQLQIEATKAIENNGEEGVAALVKMMESEYKNYSILVRHVLDRRIY